MAVDWGGRGLISTLRGETFAGRNFRVFAIFSRFREAKSPTKRTQVQIRESLSHAKCVLRKIRPIILQKMPILSESQQNGSRKTLNSRKLFQAKRIKLAIRESKSLKFRVLFFSRNFLPVKLSLHEVLIYQRL